MSYVYGRSRYVVRPGGDEFRTAKAAHARAKRMSLTLQGVHVVKSVGYDPDVEETTVASWVGGKRKKANPCRKNPTKAQKRPNKLQRMIASTKRAKQNRISAALKKFLHQANPAIETSGAMITKLKGGGFTIRPIKAKRGRR